MWGAQFDRSPRPLNQHALTLKGLDQARTVTAGLARPSGVWLIPFVLLWQAEAWKGSMMDGGNSQKEGCCVRVQSMPLPVAARSRPPPRSNADRQAGAPCPRLGRLSVVGMVDVIRSVGWGFDSIIDRRGCWGQGRKEGHDKK